MKIGIICFTSRGAKLCRSLTECLERKGHECGAFQKGSFPRAEGLCLVEGSLSQWAETAFSEKDGLIFVGAAGIAVRAIAPFIRGKTEDPACLVMDEGGQYVIPLLSGHIGGANDLAREIAAATGAIPVITTATDVNRRFAVDEWARKQNLVMGDMKLAKQVSAALLQGKEISFSSSFPVKGKLPDGLTLREGKALSISISIDRGGQEANRLRLIPPCVVLGIGCRRETSAKQIEKKVEEALEKFQISHKSLLKAASIDLKKQELGLLAFCRKQGIPLVFYSAGELEKARGDFSASPFVKGVTGVDNVCERAAVLASGGGPLIMKKQASEGVTIAAAVRKPFLSFEKQDG